MFEIETKYYEEHKSELKTKYLGKHIVLLGENIVGAYDSDEEAFGKASKKYAPGTFMIKFITTDDNDQFQRFSSLVYV